MEKGTVSPLRPRNSNLPKKSSSSTSKIVLSKKAKAEEIRLQEKRIKEELQSRKQKQLQNARSRVLAAKAKKTPKSTTPVKKSPCTPPPYERLQERMKQLQIQENNLWKKINLSCNLQLKSYEEISKALTERTNL